MRKENAQLTVISVSITIVALIAIIAHIMMPTMMIDSITLWLLVIAIGPWLVIAVVPWLAPLVKSIKLGSLEFEFQERLKKLETETTNMHTEMENMAQTVASMKQDAAPISEPVSALATGQDRVSFCSYCY